MTFLTFEQGGGHDRGKKIAKFRGSSKHSPSVISQLSPRRPTTFSVDNGDSCFYVFHAFKSGNISLRHTRYCPIICAADSHVHLIYCINTDDVSSIGFISGPLPRLGATSNKTPRYYKYLCTNIL